MSQAVDRMHAVRLHQVEGFYHVTTHAGFRRAVKAMPYPLTEPALHQQVRKLERALGVTLLERAPGRRMVPTPEGRALYLFVAPYFEQLPGVLRSLFDESGGSLVLATESFYVDTLCVDGLRAVQEKNPRVHIELIEAELDEMSQALLRGRADLGIASVIGALPEGLVYEELGGLGLELLVPARHPLAKRRAPLGPKHLEGLRCVLYSKGTVGRDYSLQAMAQAGFLVEPAVEASTAIAMRALVRAGVAPAFIPALIGDKKRPRRKTFADGTVSFDLTALLQQTVGTLPPFGLVRRAGRADRGLVATFVDAVRRRLS
jgi:DNA-binding transcriptional LysR family regulator